MFLNLEENVDLLPLRVCQLLFVRRCHINDMMTSYNHEMYLKSVLLAYLLDKLKETLFFCAPTHFCYIFNS